MRILWLSHFIPYPPRGGALQRSYHLLAAAAARHDVTLVALNQRKMLPTAAGVEDASARLRDLGVDVHVFPIPSDRSRWSWMRMATTAFMHPDPYLVRWLRSADYSEFIRKLTEETQFDCVHVDTVGLAPYSARFGDLPWVMNHHNVESAMMRHRVSLEDHTGRRIYIARDAIKLAKLERSFCPRATLNLVVSELDGRRLEEVVPGVEYRVVPNGVDVEYFRPRAGGGKGGLIFVGQLDWYPNRDAVLFTVQEVWPLLREDGTDRTITFVGRNPPREIEATGDARLRATGFVDDIRPLMDEAEIYVCPIRTGGGTRLKILDALAMGKPIVATRLAVEGLGMIDGEHYLAAEAPEEFASQIKRLEGDEDLQSRLGQSGRLLVEQSYSWQTVGTELERAYEVAIDGAEGRSRSTR